MVEDVTDGFGTTLWAYCIRLLAGKAIVTIDDSYGGLLAPKAHHCNNNNNNNNSNINKQWEEISLQQLTSHMTLNAGPQQQRLESPTITPPGMR